MPLSLVFDLDDTLYPERQFAQSGFQAAAGWARAATGQPLDDLEQEMLALLDDGHLGGLFANVLETRLGPAAAERLRDGFVGAYRDHTPNISLFPDAAKLLARLGPYDDGAPSRAMGLITDGTVSVQSAKVTALGLENVFAHIVYTHGLGGRSFAKPHPASYEAMEQALGGDDVQLVYIGDNISKDFVTPNARGWISVQVDRPAHECGHRRIHHRAETAAGGAPQYVIGSLAELPDLLGL